ncbi:MAG: hypothetical protein LBU34_08710 [Planctomycetaceae bacterium]|nr:hypothetical protein [Planctomycetaceae bacterium]
MVNQLSKSGKHRAFDEISRIFEERKYALKEFFVPKNRYFMGFSENEIQEQLIEHIREAEYDACLTLLAAIEAAFRIDCDYCCRKRPKTPRAKTVRKIVQTFEGISIDRINLSKLFEQLLADQSVNRSIVNRLKQFFKFRHWLAHGRYWTFKSGEPPTFGEIYKLAQVIDGLLFTYSF